MSNYVNSNWTSGWLIWIIVLVLILRIPLIRITFLSLLTTGILLLHLVIHLITLFFNIVSSLVCFCFCCISQSSIFIMLVHIICFFFRVTCSRISSLFDLLACIIGFFSNFIFLCLLLREFLCIMHFLS